jgi:hypothetical protein
MSARHQLGVVGVLGAVAISLALASGCATSSLSQAKQADELRDYDTAVAQYTKAVRENPKSQEAHVGLERARQFSWAETAQRTLAVYRELL